MSKNILVKNILIFLLSGILSYSQEKMKLKIEDYHLWHNLQMGTSSENGEWISYTRKYERGGDTLYLKNNITGFIYELPKGKNEILTKKGDLFFYLKSDTL